MDLVVLYQYLGISAGDLVVNIILSLFRITERRPKYCGFDVNSSFLEHVQLGADLDCSCISYVNSA